MAYSPSESSGTRVLLLTSWHKIEDEIWAKGLSNDNALVIFAVDVDSFLSSGGSDSL